MSEINNTYDKAFLLMTSALKKYEKGEFDAANKDRELANKYFNEFHSEEIENIDATTALYGESRNFGILFKVLEKNLSESFNCKEIKRKPLIEALKKIKETKLLNEQFKLFNAFSNPVNITNSSEYVNEVLAIAPKLNKKEIKSVNEDLIKFIQKHNINEMVDISNEELELYESINFVLINNKKLNKVNEFITHKNNIINYVNKNNKLNECVDIDNKFNDEISLLEQKYNNILNDDEKLFITEMLSNNSKEDCFNKNKELLISLINEQIKSSNNNNKEQWETLKQKVNESVFNEENFVVDIAKIIEIQNKLTK